MHDRELSRGPLPVNLSGGETVTLVPDAFLSFDVTLKQHRGRFHVLWEVDRSTVDSRSWRKRIRGYLSGLGDGTLAAAFGVSRLTVAVSVPDHRRQRELLSLIGSVAAAEHVPELASFFTVTATDPARMPVEAFFLSSVFAVPPTGELVPLLEHDGLEKLVFVEGGR